MTIGRLVLKEILHRKLNFALAMVAVAVAVGCLVGAVAVLTAHDLVTSEVLAAKQEATAQRLAQLEDAMRKAMLGLGFNIIILPQQQKLGDWYSEDSAAETMPEEYAQRLAQSKIITVQHLLPILQQRVQWPEKKRTIILVGTRGELPGSGGKKPMMPAVPPGTMTLGFELANSLGLKRGDPIEFRGRKFTVGDSYAMRGNKDDITAWIDLKEAQELLDRPGRINAIMAIECQCAWANLPKVRQEIARILPDTQVIERGTEALARAEARRKVADEAEESARQEEEHRQQVRTGLANLTATLVPLVMLAAAAWIALLAWMNVRDRRMEIGILRAVGVRETQILVLFLSRAVLGGVVGGVLGCLVGWLAGYELASAMAEGVPSGAGPLALVQPGEAVLAVALAPILAAAASWLPALRAARQDPAVVLRED